MGWLLLGALFWKPIFICGVTVYHLVKRDSVNTSETLAKLKAWCINLWSLVNPSV